MRIATLIAAAAVVATGCKGKSDGAESHAEGALTGEDTGKVATTPLEACASALTRSRTDGVKALLDGCRPCDVPWQPLIALSGFDPDQPPPDNLPGAEVVLDVLDACKATCTGRARDAVKELLRNTQLGKSPSQPWRKIAEACPGTLPLDQRTQRFARGTWYALDQIARALWSDDVPDAVASARDVAPLDFPLPPFSVASTALAVPHGDTLSPVPPRLHVTIDLEAVRIGPLPFVRLADGAATLAPAAGEDYPGRLVVIDELDHQLAMLVAATSDKQYSFDLAVSPALITPRAMPARRLLEVLGRMPGSRAYLAATPKSAQDAPWPEPIGAIPIFISTAPPFPDLPLLDAADFGALTTLIAALPSTASAVRLMFAADATVEHVAAALSALAAHGVDRAALEQAPPPSY